MTLLKCCTSILLLTLAGCSTSSSYKPPPVPSSAVTLNDEQIHGTEGPEQLNVGENFSASNGDTLYLASSH
ncbi:hypothetical protein F6476_13640 [Pseudomonas umsongensis]|uniref:Uncharacterized protein n=1 Tax=Pseudomonas umsongensis TaxID=198618 RepID=A0ABX4E0K7_9PSED|nr:hypothetical protein PSUM_04630 [Pseudomonas umsongensis]QFG30155.1 hypothetical protein F6476_13640 [Pseudomonas umsongensis]SDT25318.1 hypothetical protein SAMN04490206_2482 [Pseudomonas umsongensis]